MSALYTERYNARRHAPAGDLPWWTTDEARTRYAHRQDLLVVEERHGDGGVLTPRWVLGITSQGIRVQTLDQHGSILQITDFDAREGRLWRWITTMYTYPAADRYFAQPDCTSVVTSRFEPDGTGEVEFKDKATAEVHVARMTDAPVGGFWAEWPVFGEWEPLTDPNYGAPGSPEVPFSKLRA
ncbi:hypothetical protein [Cellulomonas marina]|uniref:Uncharacterized protein n=1 Tax=Cellulomonas marina TaxID=988821 RepID=A0A1I0XHC2_9CELL|nr:hypothetical protein [Cellulomonas marina]GIG29854.1 hypothetical protein Cma02nite_24540 [Cellulomonas marina]SFA99836.1 hypothetical protein SAMN05421867_10525 [Cellulomonas marina]